jgi:hypothetical protein
MKKILALLSIFLFTISNANAGILSPFASTYATIELGKSVLSHKSINSKFENSNDFFENLRQFEDIALGVHIRSSFVGINVNWSQTSLKNNRLNGYNSLENPIKSTPPLYSSCQLFQLELSYLLKPELLTLEVSFIILQPVEPKFNANLMKPLVFMALALKFHLLVAILFAYQLKDILEKLACSIQNTQHFVSVI